MWELENWWMIMNAQLGTQHIVMYGTLLTVFNSSFHTNAHNSTLSRILQSWQLYCLLMTCKNCEMKWEKVAILGNDELLPQLWDFALIFIIYVAKEGFLKTTAWNLLYNFDQKVLQLYDINKRGVALRKWSHFSTIFYIQIFRMRIFLIFLCQSSPPNLSNQSFKVWHKGLNTGRGRENPKLNDLQSCKR